jgi:hypothetical protein
MFRFAFIRLLRLLLKQSFPQRHYLVGRDGKVSYAFPGRVVDRIGNGCDDSRCCDLADAARAQGAEPCVGNVQHRQVDLAYIRVDRDVPSSLPSADAPSLIFCTVVGREPTGPNIWLRSSASFTALATAFAAIAARKTCD